MLGGCLIFFFQAEDGIRYLTVTGVQTCALPIYYQLRHHARFLSRKTWLKPGRLSELNGFWRELRELLARGTIHLVVVTDRKSTRLNSSHSQISYAVFCLQKKNHLNSQLHMLYRT